MKATRKALSRPITGPQESTDYYRLHTKVYTRVHSCLHKKAVYTPGCHPYWVTPTSSQIQLQIPLPSYPSTIISGQLPPTYLPLGV
eukprot:Pgem_evm1s4770